VALCGQDLAVVRGDGANGGQADRGRDLHCHVADAGGQAGVDRRDLGHGDDREGHEGGAGTDTEQHVGGEQAREVAGLFARAREEREGGDDQEQAGGQDPVGAEAPHQARGDAERKARQSQCRRQEGEAGPESR